MSEPVSGDDGWVPWTSTMRSGALRGRTYDVRSRPAPRPPVIVLHEVLGPSRETMELAERLADRGKPRFAVHVPALFGTHGRRSFLGLLGSKICLRREFVLFRSGRTSPIVEWLRQFVGEVSERHDGRRVGVIGMCLTGGFALAMVGDAKVGAAVASQPSLPFAGLRSARVKGDLGLSPKDRPTGGDDEAPLTILRYDRDWLCPAARGQRSAGSPLGEPVTDPVDRDLRTRAGSRGQLIEATSRSRLPLIANQHAVLTSDLNERALQRVREWLHDQLEGDAGPGAE